MKRDVDICELIQHLAENFDNEACVRFINLKIQLKGDAMGVICERERCDEIYTEARIRHDRRPEGMTRITSKSRSRTMVPAYRMK